MNKNTIFLALLLCVQFSVFSQSKLVYEYNVKALLADFSGLNSQIQHKYPQLDEGVIPDFQIGMTIVNPRSSVGLYGDFIVKLNPKSGSKQTVFGGYGAGLRYTFNVLKKSSFKLSPEFAFGMRKYKLVLGEWRSNVSIEDVLNVKNYVFSNLGVYADIGLGVLKNFNFKVKVLKDLYYDFSFGLSGGYRFDRGEWLYEGVIPVSQEIAKLSGFYVDIKTQIALSISKTNGRRINDGDKG